MAGSGCVFAGVWLRIDQPEYWVKAVTFPFTPVITKTDHQL